MVVFETLISLERCFSAIEKTCNQQGEASFVGAPSSAGGAPGLLDWRLVN